MSKPHAADQIVGKECRHITYCVTADKQSDLHVIKEWIHYKNGDVLPNLNLIFDQPREFWVTREGFRKHEDKLEWEEETRLKRYVARNNAELPKAVCRALGITSPNMSMRYLARSPYLYGTDISSQALIKYEYAMKYPDTKTPRAKVAVLDIETDVVDGREDIILIALTFKDKVCLVINKQFTKTMVDVEEKFNKKLKELLGEYVDKRNIKVEVVMARDEGHCVAEIMKRAHEWSPDFITVWNIDFDIPKIITALERGNYNLADIFSDPRVPEEYRFFRYRQGPSQKVTQSGKIMALHPADRWHVVECPAGFYFLDAMCLYKRLRVAAGNEPSYSLDAILGKQLNLSKLKFTQVDHLTGLDWHVEMQTKYKIEYMVYNIFDCIAVELLDDLTGDVAQSFPILCGYSDYSTYTSNPRKIVDDLHFVCRQKGLVIGTTSDDMVSDLDKYVVDMNAWIVTLSSYMMDDLGVKIIEQLPNQSTTIYIMCLDLDIEGTYPTLEKLMQISKETTVKELYKIEGLSDAQRREVGLNYSGGPANAIELCRTLLNLPSPNVMLAEFLKDME